MIFNKARPGSSNIGSGTDEEEDNDDHAIEAKESTLNICVITMYDAAT